MIDPAELEAWLRLVETPGLGRESVRRLLAAFASPEAAIAASTAARQEVVGKLQAAALATPPETLAGLLRTTLAWLAAEDDDGAARAVVTLGDPAYPQELLASADPPALLYAQGRIGLLSQPSIAIVGSRNPTAQGSENARAFAAQLSASGLTIVSGLALGVDAAAHSGGLEGIGSTVAVIGTGLDRVYPRRNLALAHAVAKDGLMLSEYPLGTPPRAPNFPLRNRIIAGLARGTLVVEAALHSGSLITARLANESGRDVFAIPGSIHSPQSRGCHALIKQGAKLVETAQDLLDELRWQVAAPTAANPAGRSTTDRLLEALGFDPVTLDALAARTGESTAALSVRLLDLELDGAVARLPGQLYQRTPPR